MPKIDRKTAKMFASLAGPTEVGQFGSLAAGSIAYSKDPDVIQALPQFLSGWYAAVVGSNSPAIEDMNALQYVFAYQIAYLLQRGVPEWDAETEYFIGDIVTDDDGSAFKSIADNNLNNPVTDGTKWAPFGTTETQTIDPATQSPYVLTTGDNNRTFLVQTQNGAQQFELPPPASNMIFTVKDIGGSAALNPMLIVRDGSEQIEGLAADYTLDSDYGVWNFICDGANWWLI